jgi:hypothetical protein
MKCDKLTQREHPNVHFPDDPFCYSVDEVDEAIVELKAENKTLSDDIADKIESITELQKLVEKYKSENKRLRYALLKLREFMWKYCNFDFTDDCPLDKLKAERLDDIADYWIDKVEKAKAEIMDGK